MTPQTLVSVYLRKKATLFNITSIFDIELIQLMQEMDANNFALYFPHLNYLNALPEYSPLHSYCSSFPTFNIRLHPEFQEMEEKIIELHLKVHQLEEENQELKRMLKPKRRYSKRRAHLRKQFRCPYPSCQKQYSSNIALRSHLRKKHNDEI